MSNGGKVHRLTLLVRLAGPGASTRIPDAMGEDEDPADTKETGQVSLLP